MHWVQRRAEKIRIRSHLPVIRLAVAVHGGGEERRRGCVTGDGMSAVRSADGVHSGLEITGQLIVNKGAPIEIISVGKDGGEARRLDLIPGFEPSVPSRVERGEGLVFGRQPFAEARLCVRAEAELGVNEVGKVRPVDHVRFTPNIPTVQGWRFVSLPRQRFNESDQLSPHAGVIDTVAGSGLRIDHRPAAINKAAVRVSLTHPIRGGIRVNLHDHPQAPLLSKLHQQIEVFEMELAWFRLYGCPVYPAFNRVKADRFDAVEIFTPAGSAGGIYGLEHGSARFSATVPDGHRKRTRRGRYFPRTRAESGHRQQHAGQQRSLQASRRPAEAPPFRGPKLLLSHPASFGTCHERRPHDRSVYS